MTKIICNPFVHRQTPDSSFSHFAGSWEKLEALAERHYDHHDGSGIMPGYKPGVSLLRVAPDDFFTGIIEVGKTTQLVANFKARREGELPFIDVQAKGFKTRAGRVDLVLYTKEVLDADASAAPADFEIVSINASLYRDRPDPMTPVAMARNFLELPGGTKAEYSAKEFAESILFWAHHAMRAE